MGTYHLAVGDALGDGFEGLMAAIRANGEDTTILFGVLRQKLTDALGSRVQTADERAKRRRPESHTVTVTLGEHVFAATLSGGVLTSVDRHQVNGITLRTETLGLDKWIGALGAALQAEANRSESARLALERLLSG